MIIWSLLTVALKRVALRFPVIFSCYSCSIWYLATLIMWTRHWSLNLLLLKEKSSAEVFWLSRLFAACWLTTFLSCGAVIFFFFPRCVFLWFFTSWTLVAFRTSSLYSGGPDIEIFWFLFLHLLALSLRDFSGLHRFISVDMIYSQNASI